MTPIAKSIEVEYSDKVQIHSAIPGQITLTLVEKTPMSLSNATMTYVVMTADQAVTIAATLLAAAAKEMEQ